MKRFIATVCALAVSIVTGQSETTRAQDLILNGGFETWTNPDAAPAAEGAPDNWIAHFAGEPPVGPDFEQAVGLDGTGNSLQINPGTIGARGVYQDFTPINTFEFGLEFAVQTPVLLDDRNFRVTLRGGAGVPGTPIANIRVVGAGDLQMYDGSWTTVPGGAGAIALSDFATGSLAAYRLTLSGGVNTQDPNTLRQSLRLFDVTNNDLLIDEDLGTGLWQTTPTELPIHRIFFESTSALEASFRVDNVTVATDDPLSLPGDFNGDGFVDAADYTVWRDGLGGPFVADDYNAWRQNFGRTADMDGAAIAAVPEPVSCVLALMVFFFPFSTGRLHNETSCR